MSANKRAAKKWDAWVWVAIVPYICPLPIPSTTADLSGDAAVVVASAGPEEGGEDCGARDGDPLGVLVTLLDADPPPRAAAAAADMSCPRPKEPGLNPLWVIHWNWPLKSRNNAVREEATNSI